VQKLAFNRTVSNFGSVALPSGNTARSIAFDPISGDLFVTEDIEAGASNKARIWRIDESGSRVDFGRWFHKPNGITFHPSGVMLVTEESIDGASGRVLAVGGWRNKFKRGDANGSGSVDIADPSAISNWLLSMDLDDLPECLDAADADDSGEMDGEDANLIVRFLFNGGPPPAAPGPFSCGRDPSPDLMDCLASAGCAIQ
jgi:hypothetical protein